MNLGPSSLAVNGKGYYIRLLLVIHCRCHVPLSDGTLSAA